MVIDNDTNRNLYRRETKKGHLQNNMGPKFAPMTYFV